ncbi:MAG: bifunctional phosphoribosylaminoimidazolecarboxamide formyltransferase/IMP cyclohydrolase [Deltaproteobacteria bacterium]|nr:bifunctional phosphoribosylaminoimidazolecarboxamide formyltransferase/IMP cyclohydrolase [Deltaproteobacteria bacterium]
MDIPIKKALITCYDKSQLRNLVSCLHKHGCEIVSTGGTKRAIQEWGIPVTDIASLTKQAEAFGGRVKTLSFSIAASLLFDRERDRKEAEDLGVDPIDLLVCNFYPFENAVFGKDDPSFVEWIDIGGPTMVRAAAKNFKYVGVVCRPDRYGSLVAELERNGGSLSARTRKSLMAEAFQTVADYDSQISTGIDQWRECPTLRLSYKHSQNLRYGENAHQQGAFFRETDRSFHNIQVLQGKELSYNNVLDIQAAFDSIRDLKRQACCVIKHNTPCGIAEGDQQRMVLERAWAGDSTSAFGSIVVFNSELMRETVDFLGFEGGAKKFVEIILAPSFSPQTLDYLSSQKNLRVITYDSHAKRSQHEFRFVDGGVLVQDRDEMLYERMDWVSAGTGDVSTELVQFGLKAIRPLRSNAIAIVRQQGDRTLQLLGMGCGQPNRVVAVELALRKASENLRAEFSGHTHEQDAYVRWNLGQALLVSEAFFPFPDNIDICAQHGIKTIVQPGGSIRDRDVMAACDKHGIAMMFTGLRHFRH